MTCGVAFFLGVMAALVVEAAILFAIAIWPHNWFPTE